MTGNSTYELTGVVPSARELLVTGGGRIDTEGALTRAARGHPRCPRVPREGRMKV
ncbi:predicted protein [Streptomyces sp. SPB78]|nr:predicted protein [Streptomyces sp. SPB78]